MTTEEQFEEWQDNFDPCPEPMQYHNAKAAFLAGVQAERERCALIAMEQQQFNMASEPDDNEYNDACRHIAAAIEKEE